MGSGGTMAHCLPLRLNLLHGRCRDCRHRRCRFCAGSAGCEQHGAVVFTIGGDPFPWTDQNDKPSRRARDGILFNQNVLGAKRVELLREIAPKVSRIALLMNLTNPNVKIEEADAEAGAKKLGLETITVNARNASEMETAFEQLLRCKSQRIDYWY